MKISPTSRVPRTRYLVTGLVATALVVGVVLFTTVDNGGSKQTSFERPLIIGRGHGKVHTKGMLWGAWIDMHRTGTTEPPYDMTAIKQLERQVSKRMSLVHFGTPMKDTTGAYYKFPKRLFNKVRGHGSIPFFSWSTHLLRRYSDPDFTLARVIAGRHDAYIRRWARAAKKWRHPFFLRFNWEMNGDWFPWAEQYGSNKPGEYVAAWRHVHDIFKKAGAKNATWVWCPAADQFGKLQPLKGLYPGSKYVDWTCLDGYNRDAPYTQFSDVIDSTYRTIRKLAPHKPVVIAETASTELGGSKAVWIKNMFRALPTLFPAVRALIWYDKRDGGSSPYSDWPLDSSRAATKGFAAGIKGSRYLAGGRPG